MGPEKNTGGGEHAKKFGVATWAFGEVRVSGTGRGPGPTRDVIAKKVVRVRETRVLI